MDILAREKVRAIASYGHTIELINGLYPAFADTRVEIKPKPEILNYVNRRLREPVVSAAVKAVISPMEP